MTVVGSEGGAAATTGPPGAAESAGLWAGRVVGAALLVWMGWIHLHLWSEGYKHVSTIGPLFMANFVAAIAVALLLLSVPTRGLVAGVAGAGALLAIGTVGGLAVSVNVGLFGFTENSRAPFAHVSLAVESAAALVLLATAVGAAVTPRRRG